MGAYGTPRGCLSLLLLYSGPPARMKAFAFPLRLPGCAFFLSTVPTEKTVLLQCLQCDIDARCRVGRETSLGHRRSKAAVRLFLLFSGVKLNRWWFINGG